ncbi:formin-like protein 5 [Senna tora]|uniref:Formin-like protein n=1 Tax=Senna tora TaxID=362788 RepID=A0A834WWY1_9FABA|nr:formin-like protein 5 [Senna tora]
MMVITKASFCIILVLLTTAVSSKDLDETQEVQDFLSQLLNPASGLLDEDTAEFLWTTCSVDLIHLKEEVGDLGLCFSQESPSSCTNEISSEIPSLARENIQKLINACHPQLKEIFLYCLRKNYLPHHGVTNDENDEYNVWHATCTKSLFSRSNAPRRNLGLELPQRMSMPPGPGPTVKSHIRDQEQESKESGSSSPKKETYLKEQIKASKSTKSKKGKKKKDDKNMVIIAAAAAAVSVILVVVLLCLCCCCRKSQDRKYDERPLLSLSRSDHSIGSSPRYASGNSVRDEKFGFQSSGNNSIDHKRAPSLNGNFPVESDVQEIPSTGDAGAVAARPSFDLKPPPGRVGPSPLKPPPGRPDIAPKPPSFKASSDAGGAPAPAPPPPPPAPSPPQRPKTTSGPPPPPLPALPGAKKGAGAPPPPPPRSGPAPPRPPPPMGARATRPLAIPKKAKASENADATDSEGDAGASKAKLKPFFWDKVNANANQSMVWTQLKAGSFQLDEEMMETLFGYTNPDKNKGEIKKRSPSVEFIQIIDKKKSQNLSITLRASNVNTEEICDALLEGNELPPEFLESLLKMAPTSDEELKLRLFNGNLSQLAPAERFLKALVEIPFSIKRMEALHFMGTLQEELASTKEAFAILEVASKELRSSRLFLKLLEAVLKTGNRMNSGTYRGGAQAFKLDTLLKLSDVKGVDGKTTLLHFVVKEIIRSEGIRALRGSKESKSFSSIKTEDLLEEVSTESEERYCDLGLQVVSRLSTELQNVKKAAALDADNLTGTTAKLGHGILRTKDFLNKDLKELEVESRGGFYQTVQSFVESAEIEVTSLLEEEKKIMDLVKSTGDYFHGNSGKDEGLRLFVIVRDFLIMLDKVCKEVGDAQKKAAAATAKPHKQEPSKVASSSNTRAPPSPDPRKQIKDRRKDDFSSDDES